MGRVANITVALLLLAAVRIAVLLVASNAYASSLNGASAQAMGSSGQIDVSCPASGCAVQRVSWKITFPANSSPLVSGASIVWQPALPNGTYQVYFTVYSSSGNIVGSGSAIQSGSNSPVSTQIFFSNSFSPSSASLIEVSIVF